MLAQESVPWGTRAAGEEQCCCAQEGTEEKGEVWVKAPTTGLWKHGIWQAVFSWTVSPSYELTRGWKGWVGGVHVHHAGPGKESAVKKDL